VTPADCPLQKVEDILAHLRVIQPMINKLRFFGRFALFLVGLQSLSSALTSQPNVRFISRDRIGNLNNIKMIDVDQEYEIANIPIPNTDVGNDIEAEDEMSSLVLIGPPPVLTSIIKVPPGRGSLGSAGKRKRGIPVFQNYSFRVVECYNRRHLKTSKGHMQVFVGMEMCTIIRDLHRIHKNQDAINASIPPKRIAVPVSAPGPESNFLSDIDLDNEDWSQLPPIAAAMGLYSRADGFGDRLSSVKFGFIRRNSLD
jgi:hypothetical protein